MIGSAPLPKPRLAPLLRGIVSFGSELHGSVLRIPAKNPVNNEGSMLALESVLQRRVGANPVIDLLSEILSQGLWVFPWIFGREIFGIRNLAAGQVCYVLNRFAWNILHVVGLFANPGARADRSGTASWGKGRAANGASKDGRHQGSPVGPSRGASPLLMDAHNYAGLARYYQLVQVCSSQDEEAGRASSDVADVRKLLIDEPEDELCPCSECTSHVAYWSEAYMMAYLAISMGLGNFAFIVAILWTPAVTLGPFIWTTSWATAVLTVMIIQLVLIIEIMTYFPGGTPNPAVLSLEKRLKHRAVALCLRQLLEKLTTAMDCGHGASDYSLASAVDSEAYITLHGQLLVDWRTSLEANRPLRLLLVGAPLTHSIAAVISIAVGNCVPAALVGDLVINVFVFFVLAVSYAVKNLQATRTAAQYRAAAESLSVLAARIPASRQMLRQAVLAHRDLLASFTHLEGSQAAFFGVPITFGTVRGMAVAAFSVAVGLWTVLRATGVGITLDLACRALQ